MPVISLPRTLLSLLSLAVLAAGAYLLWRWFDGYELRDLDGDLHRVRGPLWMLWLGAALLAWSFLGRFVVLLFFPAGAKQPKPAPGQRLDVVAPDGSRLNVEASGPAHGPAIVLTHGWGLNSTAWDRLRRELEGRFRVLVWDLPGLGRSGRPRDGKYSLDRFGQALGAVIEAAGDSPVLLVGHSIGGMTTQTLFRACPEPVRRKVAGVVLFNTTNHNPLCTMWLSKLWVALQRPLIEPICWATVVLSPLAWLSAWQSYLSGSSHIATRMAGFGRYATRQDVDLTSRLAAMGSPAVQAKGNLAMFHWDAREVAPALTLPVLVLAGEKDIVTLPGAGASIAKASRGRLVQVEGAGHMGFLERADLYRRALEGFAAEVFSGGDSPTRMDRSKEALLH